MKPVEERAGPGAASDPAEAIDLLSDLGAPEFPSWESGEDPAPPDFPAFPDWGPDPPPPEPSVFSWEAPVEEPPILEAPAPERTEPPAPEVEGPPPPEPSDLPDWAETTPPAEGLPPTADDAAEDSDRRARLRELAARLWLDAPRPEAAGDPLLICTLGEEDFALPLAALVEVLRFPTVTPVPHTPDWLLGVTNRRGEVLSVVDLAGFLGRRPSAPSAHRRLVVVRAGGRDGLTTGLVVDRVRGLRTDSGREGGPATVLDLDGLLQSPRMRRLGPD